MVTINRYIKALLHPVVVTREAIRLIKLAYLLIFQQFRGSEKFTRGEVLLPLLLLAWYTNIMWYCIIDQYFMLHTSEMS